MSTKYEEMPINCQTAGKRVVVTVEILRGLSAVGSDSTGSQRSYLCADDEVCRHRYTPNCRVQVLNDGAS